MVSRKFLGAGAAACHSCGRRCPCPAWNTPSLFFQRQARPWALLAVYFLVTSGSFLITQVPACLQGRRGGLTGGDSGGGVSG